MATGGVSIKLTGDKELQRKLKALQGKDQKKVVRKALRAGGKIILAESKRLVPVDSGRLKKSLKLRAAKGKRQTFGVQVMTGSREELGIDPNDKYYYPAAIELGIDQKRSRSYLRAAVKSKKRQFFAAFGREVAAGILRIARGKR